jgi:diguanylate cyclase (GGDEF)-like protein
MSRLLCCWLLLGLWQPIPALAQRVLLDRLAGDPPAAEVLAGRHDAALQAGPAGAARIREASRQPVWWRVRVDHAVAATTQPVLQLESPYLTVVEAWLPGRTRPSWHAIYGPHADPRLSTRALQIALPQGLMPGQAVWLRVHARGSMPMPVTIVPLDAARHADLVHAGWRAFILGSTAVLAVLAISLWVRLRERIYGYFTANVMCVLLYLLGIGGEARAIPGLAQLFGASLAPTRVIAALGGAFLIAFQRHYLDTARNMPRMNRALKLCAGWLVLLAAVNLVSEGRLPAMLGNLGLIAAALMLFGSCLWLGLHGRRQAWAALLAWAPLLLFAVLRSLELIGWSMPGGDGAWIAHGLSLALALSCLMVTIGLADQMLELRRDRDRVNLLATVDGLTGALTRVAIEQRLQQEIDYARLDGRPLSVLFIDIDHFKRINDSFGHAAGDACLRQVVQCVRRRLRDHDALGRQGGDELVAVLPGAALEDARGVAEDIRAALAASPLQLGEASRSCTLSMGVAELRPGERIEALLQRADTALYASKADGRDRVSVATFPQPEESVA